MHTPLASGQRRTEPLFHHPRANRETRLLDAVVAYEFKRGKRRTIGFSISRDGLVVRAPQWVTLKQVDAALQEKSNWIIQKLGETAQRQQRLAAREIEWIDGVCLPYQGELITVTLDPPAAAGANEPPRRGDRSARTTQVTLQSITALDALTPTAPSSLRLLVALPADASQAAIRDVVQGWLMTQAKQLFIERLDHFAPLLQVKWRSLALSNARTRWGSARSDGSIRLNWRLIHFNPSIIDYVVAHELSHLREMNHSPRFWDTVRSVLPNYAVLRKQLKEEAAPR